MLQITAHIIGSRRPRKWTCRSEGEAEKFILNLLSVGFRETSADRTVCTWYPGHRISRVEVKREE